MSIAPQSNSTAKQLFILDTSADNWLDELELNELDLKVCIRNLENIIVDLKRHRKALPLAEQYQNQFIIQQENINQLKQEIRSFRKWLAKTNATIGLHRCLEYYQILEERSNNFNNAFDELLQNFRKFFKHEFFITHCVY